MVSQKAPLWSRKPCSSIGSVVIPLSRLHNQEALVIGSCDHTAWNCRLCLSLLLRLRDDLSWLVSMLVWLLASWETICCDKGTVTLHDALYSFWALVTGFTRPSPPSLAGKARSSLFKMDQEGRLVMNGIKVWLIAFSSSCNRWHISSTVLQMWFHYVDKAIHRMLHVVHFWQFWKVVQFHLSTL